MLFLYKQLGLTNFYLYTISESFVLPKSWQQGWSLSQKSKQGNTSHLFHSKLDKPDRNKTSIVEIRVIWITSVAQFFCMIVTKIWCTSVRDTHVSRGSRFHVFRLRIVFVFPKLYAEKVKQGQELNRTNGCYNINITETIQIHRYLLTKQQRSNLFYTLIP